MSSRMRNFNLLGTTFPIDSYIPTYAEGEVYKVNDIVVLEQGIWRCTTNVDVAPATLDESFWEKVGGSDALVATINRTSATWTSSDTFAKTREAVGKNLIIVVDSVFGGATIPERITDNTTNIEFIYRGIVDSVETKVTVTAKSDWTLTVSYDYFPAADDEGYIKQANVRTTDDGEMDDIWDDETASATNMYVNNTSMIEYTKKVKEEIDPPTDAEVESVWDDDEEIDPEKYLTTSSLLTYQNKLKEKLAFINDPTSSGLPTSILNLFYPVGSYYETSDASFNPNTSWGGTWVKDSTGKVTVAQDTDTFATVGDTGGTEGNTLVAGNMPLHKWGVAHLTSADSKYMGITNVTHAIESYSSLTYKNEGSTGNDNDWVHTFTFGKATPDEVNNLQPYVVVIRWHRTA